MRARAAGRSTRFVPAIAVALALSSCGGEEAQRSSSPATATETTASVPELRLTPPPIQGKAPKRQDLVGTWAKVGERLLFRFGADGALVFDRVDLENPYARGTWTLRGRVMTLRTLGPGCVEEWRWRTGILRGSDRVDDELHVVFIDEGCDQIAGESWTLARIAA